jgi:hypothetical protein
LPGGGLDPAWPAAGREVAWVFQSPPYVPWVQNDGTGGALVVSRAPKPNRAPSETLIVRHVLANGSLDPGWPAAELRINRPSEPPYEYSFEPSRGVPDGAGGGIVVWAGGDRMRAQRVTAAGGIAAGWPAGGLVLRDVPYYSDEFPPLMSVVASGPDHFFVAWTEAYSSAREITLQRFHRDGTLAAAWPASAQLVHEYLDAGSSSSLNARMITDGSTGVYLTWLDGTSRPRGIRLLADGSIASGWSADGLELNDPGSAPVASYGCCGNFFDIANGANSGIVVTWRDGRNPGPWLFRSRWLLADGSPDPNQPDSGRAVTPPGTTTDWAVSLSDGQGGVYVGWRDNTQCYCNTLKLTWVPYDASLVGVPPTPRAHGVALRAWPNPARGGLEVEFALPTGSRAGLELLDVTGRRVRSLEVLGAGPHVAKLTNLGGVAPGVYLPAAARAGKHDSHDSRGTAPLIRGGVPRERPRFGMPRRSHVTLSADERSFDE